MAGREDFAIIKARALHDARILAAADLYVARKIAREPTAHAAVVGHIAMLGLWASRETDDGIVPGDGVAVVAAATLCGRAMARKIVGCLAHPDVDLVTDAGDGNLRLRGFDDAYAPLIRKRQSARQRAAKWRAQQEVENASRNAYAKRDVTPPVTPPVTPSVRPACGTTGPDRTGPESQPIPFPGGEGLSSAVAGDPEPEPDALAELRRVVRETRPPPDATAAWLHDEIERRLVEIGWAVEREVPVPDRGDGRAGAIDLVVTDPVPIAIELDRRSPRRKSLEKLSAFDGARVVVLREPPRTPITEPGVEILVAGGRSVELRPAERGRYAQVLDYVIRCGIRRRTPVSRSTPVALERRRELQTMKTTDAEIAERLATDYAWVTPERLARWKDGAS